MTFSELGLPPALVAALAKQDIATPLPVQTEALPALLAGRDAYLNSETGSGKTLAYLLPAFCRLVAGMNTPQVIIVAPTHELAIQIQRQACDLAQNAGLPIRTLLLIGGTDLRRQVDKLKKQPQVIVGSPGRIVDLVEMGKLKMETIGTLVIDEADRLLVGDSLATVRKLIAATPAHRQLIFVSATEQPECEALLDSLAPARVTIRAAATPVNARIEHGYLVCEARDKPDRLRQLLHALKPTRAIVFVHRNETAETIAAKLAHHQVSVADLHGAADKLARKKAMDAIRDGSATVLIASDVAARGLDIKGVTHVINADAPTESKAYLHRVGRTARAGARGYAVTLMDPREVRLVDRYQSDLGITLTPLRLREGQVMVEKDRPDSDPMDRRAGRAREGRRS